MDIATTKLRDRPRVCSQTRVSLLTLTQNYSSVSALTWQLSTWKSRPSLTKQRSMYLSLSVSTRLPVCPLLPIWRTILCAPFWSLGESSGHSGESEGLKVDGEEERANEVQYETASVASLCSVALNARNTSTKADIPFSWEKPCTSHCVQMPSLTLCVGGRNTRAARRHDTEFQLDFTLESTARAVFRLLGTIEQKVEVRGMSHPGRWGRGELDGVYLKGKGKTSESASDNSQRASARTGSIPSGIRRSRLFS